MDPPYNSVGGRKKVSLLAERLGPPHTYLSHANSWKGHRALRLLGGLPLWTELIKIRETHNISVLLATRTGAWFSSPLERL